MLLPAFAATRQLLRWTHAARRAAGYMLSSAAARGRSQRYADCRMRVLRGWLRRLRPRAASTPEQVGPLGLAQVVSALLEAGMPNFVHMSAAHACMS